MDRLSSGALCWRGVRLASVSVGADPDAPPLPLAVPVGWSEMAASGLAGLIGASMPGSREIRLPDAAERWITPLDRAARAQRRSADLGETLHAMLLLRQGCADGFAWTGEPLPRGADPTQGFVLHLGGFADQATGFDTACFVPAVEAAALALSLLAGPGAPVGAIRIAGLDLMLACLGLDYASEEARRTTRRILLAAREAIARVEPRVTLVAGAGGAAEMLLGVATNGYAPAFCAVDEDGRLSAASRARLVHRGVSVERALVASLQGEDPLPLADVRAHRAMHEAVAPLLDHAPPVPREATPPLRGTLRPAGERGRDRPARHERLPARSRGFFQKVSIGGHRLSLRTGQYDDGRLGEVSLGMHGRGDGTTRGWLEAFSSAVSLGLQHGVPLAAYVEAFAHARFGARGAVEGDPSILVASSPADYAFRTLSDAYLGRPIAERAAEPHRAMRDDDSPTLPFDMPSVVERPARQRSLRLVHAS